eukprot:CAMPEP_0198149992 /NCGR_PEP_ID=MMETSP1443-20131203/48943_1 /TAXON_ID=186043 /ORGANISM="Entomoneis sp., Strain CCMP2396" /LENGTH=231 /DNA_ID=CAMNT_0043815173 /DNA_START=54 /DNA_END=746 /DNA_ORIENTATION=+
MSSSSNRKIMRLYAFLVVLSIGMIISNSHLDDNNNDQDNEGSSVTTVSTRKFESSSSPNNTNSAAGIISLSGNENQVDDSNDNDNDNDVDVDVDNRPWMILHVGPPKTGTTTIQSGLNTMAKMLAEKDNIYYVGERMGKTEVVHLLSNDDDDSDNNNNNTVTMFPMKYFAYNGQKRPTTHFVEVLMEHRKRNHNVLISSEHYTSKLTNMPVYWNRLYDYTFLRQSAEAAAA